MRISPIAIGIDVVPTCKLVTSLITPGDAYPAPTPRIIAAKIQPVRYRSRNESLRLMCSTTALLLDGFPGAHECTHEFAFYQRPDFFEIDTFACEERQGILGTVNTSRLDADVFKPGRG